MEQSLEFAKFYDLPNDLDIREITEDLLSSSHVTETRKQIIRVTERRIFVFNYPSEGLRIKGLVSFVPQAYESPMLVFLRGGNRLFGILNPASDLLCPDHYTVFSTTYRGSQRR